MTLVFILAPFSLHFQVSGVVGDGLLGEARLVAKKKKPHEEHLQAGGLFSDKKGAAEVKKSETETAGRASTHSRKMGNGKKRGAKSDDEESGQSGAEDSDLIMSDGDDDDESDVEELTSMDDAALEIQANTSAAAAVAAAGKTAKSAQKRAKKA